MPKPYNTVKNTAEATGPIVGTLAGAAPPWMETWGYQVPASDLDLADWPTGREPVNLGAATRHDFALEKARQQEYEDE